MRDVQDARQVPGPACQARVLAAWTKMQAMQRERGVVVWKTFVPLVQLPLGFGMFRLLRSMATLPVPSFEDGGVLWFLDLTVPDPFFVLPLASAAMMYLSLRVSPACRDACNGLREQG